MTTTTFDVSVPVGAYVPIAEGADEISLSNKRDITIMIWAGDEAPPAIDGQFGAIGHELKENMGIGFGSGIPVYATAIGLEGVLSVTATYKD